MKYKMMKVADSQDMPQDVRDAFYYVYEAFITSNDNYVAVEVDYDLEPSMEDVVINNWLKEISGAVEGEKVLVHFWW